MSGRRLFTIKDGGDQHGFVYLNPQVAEELGAELGSVIIFEGPDNAFWGAAEVRISEQVSPDTILVDSFVLEGSLLMEGDTVFLELYKKDLQALDFVEFGLRPMGDNVDANELVIKAGKNIRSLESLIDNRLVYRGMSFKWPELGVKVEILNTRPALIGKSFARLTFEALRDHTGYQFRVVGVASPFNAILCVDVSGSMRTTDVFVRDIAHAREGLKDLAGMNADLSSFLDRFEEGGQVSRAEAAAMAVLLYLAEKVGRGYGEKVAVITFEKEASEMVFMDSETGKLQPFVECTGRNKNLGLQMISERIIDRVDEGGSTTAIGTALQKARAIRDAFGSPRKPTMLLLLTDGMNTSGPPPMEVLKQSFSDIQDLIIYCVGLGERSEIDEEIMLAIAEFAGGTYRHVDNMRDLLDWYSRLAIEFTYVIRQSSSP
ncbi:MAG: VWA domain-containing protein [Candidatus Thorarchaeota archaeon]